MTAGFNEGKIKETYHQMANPTQFYFERSAGCLTFDGHKNHSLHP